jgi:hypothetical protein
MRDTGFVVPREKRARRAGLCGFDAKGQLTALTTAPGRHARAERPDDYADIVDIPEYGVRDKRGDFDPLISDDIFYRPLDPLRASAEHGAPTASTS